ncbi:hypothetical protein QNI22_04335 [Cytophagaceae bacterium BD1B2-1]|uniref:Transposase n=1 Tax=Xanthocytophaga agilis TaxID=3048010 RepID=A0AAE3R1R7_9BACT|nr:hypothetical protein [Xanthocytophaga agilis]
MQYTQLKGLKKKRVIVIWVEIYVSYAEALTPEMALKLKRVDKASD